MLTDSIWHFIYNIHYEDVMPNENMACQMKIFSELHKNALVTIINDF